MNRARNDRPAAETDNHPCRGPCVARRAAGGTICSAVCWLIVLTAWSATAGQVAEPSVPASQPVAETRPEPSAEPEVVAATVDGLPITVSEVQRQLQQALRGRPPDPAARLHLQAQALAQLIDRQLVQRYLDQNQLSASADQIQLAMARLEKQLASRNVTMPQHLGQLGLNVEQLQRELAWQLSWRRYLDRYVTDANLRRYFADHPADFDGRRLRVAQILLRVSGERPEAAAQALERAEQLRARIASGELDFAAAARQHSDAPSGRDGGDLGWIERHQPMPEPFSAAAFALEAGQVSPPVISPLGVHLILCQEVEAGKRQWSDVREALEAAIGRYLFTWAANQQRPQARIEFTGSAPYFRPGTGELMLPGAPAP
ncbi:MAG: peptidylprolyl isomerase [Pirellulaceae bacterium]|nr:peptidylprolyl isomerase [Pirellulaceae bacterium]